MIGRLHPCQEMAYIAHTLNVAGVLGAVYESAGWTGMSGYCKGCEDVFEVCERLTILDFYG